MTSNDAGARFTRRAALALPLLAAPVLLGSSPARAEKPSATLTLHRVDVALLLNAGWGGGTLYYDGHHAFKIKGLGVGGIGVSKLEAHGNVFRLTKLEDFGGLYGSVQAGAVAGDEQLHGGIWLQNPAGVQIHLVPRRQGVSLNLGASGVLITFDT